VPGPSSKAAAAGMRWATCTAGGGGRNEGCCSEEKGKSNEDVGCLGEKGESACVRMCKVHGELIWCSPVWSLW